MHFSRIIWVCPLSFGHLKKESSKSGNVGGKWNLVSRFEREKKISLFTDDTILSMEIHTKKLSEFGKVLGFNQYTKIICISK